MRHASMRIALCLLGLLLPLVAADAQAPSVRVPKETLEGATRAAREALGTFTRLVTARNARDMGFETPEEVRSATVGTPLPEFLIRLDELQRFEAGADPGRLLHENGLFLFPVLVGENVRSSLSIRHDQGAFKAVAFGAPAFIRKAGEVVARIPGGADAHARAVLVRVPALNVFFVAFEEEGKLLFASVLDDARFGLKAGEPIPAAMALEHLVPAAKEHKGLPS